MRSRTRVALLAAGVALAGVATASAVPDDAPVATSSPAPANSSAGDSAVAESTATSTTSNTSAGRERSQTPPKGSMSATAGIRELRTAGNGKNTIVVADGAVTAATADTGKSLTTGGADAFTVRYAAAFGLTDAHSLSKTQTAALPGGDTVNRYQQTAGGLPILGGQIVVTSHGKLVRSAIAETSGLSPVSTKATVPAAAAATTALTAAATETGVPAATLTAGRPQLALYDPTLIGAPGAASLRPTWQVAITATDGGEVATVLVDALDGTARLTMSDRQSARSRIVCDLAGTKVDTNNAAAYRCTPSTTLGAKSTTRKEGGAVSTVAEVNKVYDMLGATYDFYKANFGVDSFDGHGAQLQATVRVCDVARCPFRNAFWEGTQFVFGDGFATDDVVAHEYTHGVTEYSSHLLYAYQSGALNEALSDIMGEFVDQQYTAVNEANPSLKWQLGEDLPSSIGTLRSMDNPNLYGQPKTVGGTNWDNGEDDSGGVHTNSGVANYAAYLIAAGPNGIGNAKSAQLWWRVMHLLPSAADYGTLATALTSACTQLVGHFGFTPTDCANLEPVISQTGMRNQAAAGLTKVALCPTSAAQPVDTIYYDGFEKPGTWPVSNTYNWLNIPSDVARYQYAAVGTGSLNGWAPSTTGNGTTATMPQSITVPATGNTYVHFQQAALDASTGASTRVQASVDGGAWAALPAAVGPAQLAQTTGYSDVRLDLTSWAGKSVRLRFVLAVNAGNTNSYDWYLDDFRAYTCAARPSAPTGYAYYDGTNVVVSTLAAAYLPAGQSLDHWEFQYSPALTGGPTSVAGTQTGFTVTTTEPAVARTVKVRAVSNTGVAGDWTDLSIAPYAPVSCQKSAYPIFSVRARGCATSLPRR
ncbi:Zn-dependent metalloprotease [Hamadaea flava]|uniref:M4 family metallopeptidase n=1 Tax=Hamadaea flava TaxID=1742688 RepID=A0ABV8LER0_9ACTN|nr:M4 family metallopeptidase [Hamadaea flava]MCP2326128.1 Zn-dependent metalloprotease [Hamadaea flava]